MNITCALTPGADLEPRIAPLFWQHGEEAEALRDEMRAMRSVGIRQCVVESRPHPDYLGPGWWQSLDTILDEAQRLGMQVWICDDGAYPSGHAGGDFGGKILDKHPHLVKVYLAQRLIDTRGPVNGAFFRIGAWLESDEQLVAVVAARRPAADSDAIDPATLTDLTGGVKQGKLPWDVPDGWWRVFVLVRTRRGGEEWTKNYLNPLVPQAVDAFLLEVHEEHFRRYRELFGKTITGFFTDEPRFGNCGTYDAILGKFPMVLPWCDDLLAELDSDWNGGFRAALPALWNDAGELSARARYRYMTVVSRRFGDNYSGRIGRWCREHGVRLIGHIVEDNNAHARLGFGPGHFFRSLVGQDMSGFDMVNQVWPGLTQGRAVTAIGNLDLTFFYWGMGKMASSLARLDASKAGMTMCEIFGAYGWQFGLTEMKWLTDHACSRGANFLMPHAFTPKFPDPDCPPHYYAHGNNPQWRHFGVWSAYAARVCHLLSGGQSVASVAVLYHAEAEWAGACEHFHHAVAALAKRQIDCDELPIDMLVDETLTRVKQGSFTINGQRFACLIVPFAQRLPLACIRRIVQLLGAGVRVVFTGQLPTAASDGPAASPELETLRSFSGPGLSIRPAADLPDSPAMTGISDFIVEATSELLRVRRYRRPDMELLFCTNEDTATSVEATLRIRQAADPLCYDAMTDEFSAIPFERSGQDVSVKVTLSPYGSLFIVFAVGSALVRASLGNRLTTALQTGQVQTLLGPWRVSLSPAMESGGFAALRTVNRLDELTGCADLREFSGVIAYETTRTFPAAEDERRLDLGRLQGVAEVFLDGESQGVRICPPHLFCLGRPAAGEHRLRIEVATTLAGRLGDNGLDRSTPQFPPGLIGPVRTGIADSKLPISD